MGVEIKELENGPEWLRGMGRNCSLEEASEIINEIMDEDVAYDTEEIDEMVGDDTFVSFSTLTELESVGVLEQSGGMYYIGDKSKAKYIDKVTGQ